MSVVIGLTGQTGAGKSYVREMFWEKGAAVIDADSVSHDITENNIDCIYDIVNHFSCAVLNEKGTINRKALGRRVFSDKKELLALNRLIFPYIREAIDAEVERYKAEGKEAIVIDGATIIESGCLKICDMLVAVTADEEIRRKRIMKRDKISEEDAKRRILAQKPEEFYTENADFTIENNGSSAEVEHGVNRVLKNLVNIKEKVSAED